MYNIDILTGMRWMAEEWSACPEQVISNCFLQRLKQSGKTETANGVQDDEKETFESIAQNSSEYIVSCTWVVLQNMLNLCDENDVVEEF